MYLYCKQHNFIAFVFFNRIVKRKNLMTVQKYIVFQIKKKMKYATKLKNTQGI